MKANERPVILLVDDVQDNLDLLCEVFDGEPYELLTAQTAETALELARGRHPDVAVLDVQMPDVDGYELCRRLRAEAAGEHLPILFLTAYRTASQDAVRGLDLGACDYVTKPFDADELRARVRAALRLHDEQAQAVDEAKRVTRRLLGR
jgi:DNA-binding response OmpR family regulator